MIFISTLAMISARAQVGYTTGQRNNKVEYVSGMMVGKISRGYGKIYLYSEGNAHCFIWNQCKIFETLLLITVRDPSRYLTVLIRACVIMRPIYRLGYNLFVALETIIISV